MLLGSSCVDNNHTATGLNKYLPIFFYIHVILTLLIVCPTWGPAEGVPHIVVPTDIVFHNLHGHQVSITHILLVLAHIFLRINCTNACRFMVLFRYSKLLNYFQRFVGEWPVEEVEESGGYCAYLEHVKGWDKGTNTVFIFDNAQLTYWDEQLWVDFFRVLRDYNNLRLPLQTTTILLHGG